MLEIIQPPEPEELLSVRFTVTMTLSCRARWLDVSTTSSSKNSSEAAASVEATKVGETTSVLDRRTAGLYPGIAQGRKMSYHCVHIQPRTGNLGHITISRYGEAGVFHDRFDVTHGGCRCHLTENGPGAGDMGVAMLVPLFKP